MLLPLEPKKTSVATSKPASVNRLDAADVGGSACEITVTRVPNHIYIYIHIYVYVYVLLYPVRRAMRTVPFLLLSPRPPSPPFAAVATVGEFEERGESLCQLQCVEQAEMTHFFACVKKCIQYGTEPRVRMSILMSTTQKTRAATILVSCMRRYKKKIGCLR